MALLRRPAELAEAWLARLEALVEGELAQHWQITTIFLRAVVREWQLWLDEQQLLDVGTARVLALATQAEAWEAAPPAGLVVAAGIGMGGTIPAAAALLRVVAGILPRGFVVLHDEDPATADLPTEALNDAPTHPFHEMWLLNMMSIPRTCRWCTKQSITSIALSVELQRSDGRIPETDAGSTIGLYFTNSIEYVSLTQFAPDDLNKSAS
jgi:hypothetical protein